MTTAAKLRALADEVEALTGPDREMDARIACALYPIILLSLDEAKWATGSLAGAKVRIEYYTSSIDAAASLMPEGWEVEVYDDRRFRQRWCVVTHPPAGVYVPKPDVWIARQGATEPIARCAAALRARAVLRDEAAPTPDTRGAMMKTGDITDDVVVAALQTVGGHATAVAVCDTLVSAGHPRRNSQLAIQRAIERGRITVEHDWRLKIAA